MVALGWGLDGGGAGLPWELAGLEAVIWGDGLVQAPEDAIEQEAAEAGVFEIIGVPEGRVEHFGVPWAGGMGPGDGFGGFTGDGAEEDGGGGGLERAGEVE